MCYLATYTVQICYKNYVGNNNDSRRHKKSQNHEKPVIGDSGWCGYWPMWCTTGNKIVRIIILTRTYWTELLVNFYYILTYQILLATFTYCPKPNRGGTANIADKNQNERIYREVQNVLFVLLCQDRSNFTTDKYLTVAIPVMVYKEFIPGVKIFLA